MQRWESWAWRGPWSAPAGWTPYQSAAIYQKKSRGLLIGSYLILDKLGQGGMGVVFKAQHRKTGKVVALKILPPSFARDQQAVLRFKREIEAAGRLKHPNIVAALDADEDRGVHFLVMDYVACSDLDRVVRERGPMPVVQAIDCVIQAARGLEAAHAQGIVHRDIKPGNLMLDTAGMIRVLDLGLARIVDAANPFSKTAAGRLTESGMYMGTVDYVAPEQAEDSHRVDHRADIYSLGCTLYYLLTGKEPFPGETVLKRLLAHMERPAPSIRALRPAVAPAVDSAYQKMMAKRPDDRPASMAEVIALLESCKASGVEVEAQAGEAPKSRPELKVFNEPMLKRAGSAETKADPSIFAVGELRERTLIEHDLNLEDLVMDVRPEVRPAPLPPLPTPAPARIQPLKRRVTRQTRGRPSRNGLVLVGWGQSPCWERGLLGSSCSLARLRTPAAVRRLRWPSQARPVPRRPEPALSRARPRPSPAGNLRATPLDTRQRRATKARRVPLRRRGFPAVSRRSFPRGESQATRPQR